MYVSVYAAQRRDAVVTINEQRPQVHSYCDSV